MSLNSDQLKAEQDLLQFLFSPESEYILEGSAGTGKTFLIKHLIDTLIPSYKKICKALGKEQEFESIILTATTHKAVSVLNETIDLEAKTVHGALNLGIRHDFNTGNVYTVKGKNWNLIHNAILIVDEYTMLDKHVVRLMGETLVNCKVIYVGDSFQLSPVKESNSVISSRVTSRTRLKVQQRALNKPLLSSTIAELEASVELDRPAVIYTDGVEIIHGSGSFIESEIIKEVSAKGDMVKLLTYTNSKTNVLNAFVRSALGRSPDRFYEGDILINTDYLRIGRVSLYSHDEVIVTSVGEKSDIDIYHDGSLLLEVVTLQVSTTRSRMSITLQAPTDLLEYRNVLKHLSRNKDWSKFFKLKESLAELRPNYSQTIHKAQGSTYDTVFVDLTDISICRNISQARRLLYVALSRAKERIVLFGELSNRLGTVYERTI